MVRHVVPQPVKLALRLAQRCVADLRTGLRRRFARPGRENAAAARPLVPALCLTQPVFNATTELSRINKIHNMTVAASSIEATVIHPGEIFSFYRVVGRPSRANHFREGINIVDGRVVEDFGGGLCQLSSIIYHVSLRAGLRVLERWNHSVDLYHDRPRYTPLGADATVFYGYKDLRILNDTAHALRFRFEIGDDLLACILESDGAIHEHEVVFETVHDDERGSRVVSKRQGEAIAVSTYRKA